MCYAPGALYGQRLRVRPGRRTTSAGPTCAEDAVGKRSDFERRQGDVYPTPLAAVEPLIPHLKHEGIWRFAEPCCGDGDLVGHLGSFGFHCVYRGDIRDGHDALDRVVYASAPDYDLEPDAIITNPPYTRDVMHALIAHFITVAPTWLLLELDWAATLQAGRYMQHCSHIVTIGRIKWMPDSPYTGKDNHAWFRFQKRKCRTIFHPRALADDARPSINGTSLPNGRGSR